MLGFVLAGNLHLIAVGADLYVGAVLGQGDGGEKIVFESSEGVVAGIGDGPVLCILLRLLDQLAAVAS